MVRRFTLSTTVRRMSPFTFNLPNWEVPLPPSPSSRGKESSGDRCHQEGIKDWVLTSKVFNRTQRKPRGYRGKRSLVWTQVIPTQSWSGLSKPESLSLGEWWVRVSRQNHMSGREIRLEKDGYYNTNNNNNKNFFGHQGRTRNWPQWI